MREKIPVATLEKANRQEKANGQAQRLSPEDIAKLVDKAIGTFEGTLENASGKFSVGDFVRLLQIRKELAGDAPGNVTVRWVEECKETPRDE